LAAHGNISRDRCTRTLRGASCNRCTRRTREDRLLVDNIFVRGIFKPEEGLFELTPSELLEPVAAGRAARKLKAFIDIDHQGRVLSYIDTRNESISYVTDDHLNAL
jgi:hypothetical protein